jgi:hypothetical protein
MKTREIIAKHQLPFKKERRKVNKILTNLFNSKQKELEASLEEDCVVRLPLTYMQYHGGIDSTYYFGTKWGTIRVYMADSPEDCTVEFLENKVLGLINKPVETTNEQPKCKCGHTTKDKCPDYFCKGCCMPPHNCLCSHED